jgi:predicted flap endonuclease-1-like 5' DNA nuclease
MTCYDFLKPYVLWAAQEQLHDPYRYVLGTRLICVHLDGAFDTIDARTDVDTAHFVPDGENARVRLRGSGKLTSTPTQAPSASEQQTLTYMGQADNSESRKILIQIDANQERIRVRVGDIGIHEIVINFIAECRDRFLLGFEANTVYVLGLQQMERTDSGWISVTETFVEHGATIVTQPEAAAPAEPVVDDLKRIEGIGPKSESVLNSIGITSFAQLSACDPDQLQISLTAAGLQLIPGAALSWPAQAALAAGGHWNALKLVQDVLLKGGRSSAPDDLQKIRGIGPAIAAKLETMGITTFRQLAHADAEQLETDLKAAGVSLQLGTALSWPEQAKLASENRWVELETMQKELAQLHDAMEGSADELE